MMKKSTFGAVLAFLFAAAGALTAAALDLYHRAIAATPAVQRRLR